MNQFRFGSNTATRPPAGTPQSSGGMMFKTRPQETVQKQQQQENTVQASDKFHKVILAAKNLEKCQMTQNAELEAANMQMQQKDKIITDQRMVITSLTQENSALNAEIIKRRLECDDMKNTLSGVCAQCNVLQQELGNISANQAAGDKDAAEIKESIRQYSEWAVSIEAALSAKAGEIQQLQEQVSRSTEEIAAREAGIQELMDKVNTADSKASEDAKIIDSLNHQLAELGTEHATLLARHAELDDTVKELNIKMHERDEKYNDSLAKANAKTSDVQYKLDEANDKIAKAIRDYDELKKKSDQYENDIRDLNSRLSASRSDNETLQNNLRQANETVNMKNQALGTAEQQLISVKREYDINIDNLKKKINDTEADLTRAKEANNQLQSKYSDDTRRLNNEIQDVMSAKNKLADSLGGAELKIKELERQLSVATDARTDDANKTKAEMQKLNKIIEERDQKIVDIQAASDQIKKQAAEQIANIEKSIENYKAQIEERDKEILDLSKNHDKELSKASKEAEKEIKALKKQLDSLEGKNIVELEKLKRAMELEAADADKNRKMEDNRRNAEIESLNKTVRGLEAEKKKLDDQLSGLKNIAASHKTEIDNLSDMFGKKENMYTTDIKNLKDDLTDKDKEIARLTKLIEAEKKTKNKKSDAAVKDATRELEDKMSAKDAEIAALKKEKSKAEGSLAAQISAREADSKKWLEERKELLEKIEASKADTRSRALSDANKTPVIESRPKHKNLNMPVDALDLSSVPKSAEKPAPKCVDDDDELEFHVRKLATASNIAAPLTPFPRQTGTKKKKAVTAPSSQNHSIFDFVD